MSYAAQDCKMQDDFLSLRDSLGIFLVVVKHSQVDSPFNVSSLIVNLHHDYNMYKKLLQVKG